MTRTTTQAPLFDGAAAPMFAADDLTAAPAKALRAYEIPVYRVMLVRDSAQAALGPQVAAPATVAAIFNTYLEGADREHLVVAMLDTKHRVIGITTVSVGTINSSLVSARDVFKPAILANAAAIVIGHNHPSGDTRPSAEDLAITRTLIDAGKLLEIPVLDHVVLDPMGGGFTSLRETTLIMF